MPRVVVYDVVLDVLTGLGCEAAYPNGGVFAPRFAHETLGLLTGDDATVRPGLTTRRLADATPAGLAGALVDGWSAGELWLMPAHHWAYELQHGGKAWLADALARLGVDAEPLAGRTAADALAFETGEADAARSFAEGLWTHLDRSDFAAAIVHAAAPPTLALLHHHGQLWWRTPAGQP